MKHYPKHNRHLVPNFRRLKSSRSFVQPQSYTLSRHELGELVAQMID